MALDVGDRRIGVALSDELATVSSPLCTLDRGDDGEALREILRVIREKGVGEVIVGVPYGMDGTPGVQARKVLRFADRLQDELGTRVTLWDESFSTREAERLPKTRRGKSRGQKARLDRRAAAFILQEVLETRRREAGPGG